MRFPWVLLMAAVVWLPLSSIADGPASAQTREIRVTGKAVRKVDPDRAVWKLTVRNFNDSASVASRAHAELREALIAVLDDKGIAEDAREISPMEIGLRESTGSSARSARSRYQAVTAVTFVATDLDEYVPLWEAIGDLDRVEIQEVTFSVGDRAGIVEALQLEAAQDARRRAEALAAELGMRVGDPIVVNARIQTDGAQRDSSGQGPPTKLTLAAGVEASFELLPLEE